MNGPNKIELSPAKFESEDACWKRVGEFVRGLIDAGYEVSLTRDCEGVFILLFDSEVCGEWKCVWEKETI